MLRSSGTLDLLILRLVSSREDLEKNLRVATYLMAGLVCRLLTSEICVWHPISVFLKC